VGDFDQEIRREKAGQIGLATTGALNKKQVRDSLDHIHLVFGGSAVAHLENPRRPPPLQSELPSD
jgi:hypothetical protein